MPITYSCDSKPFIKLGADDSNAPTLKYNIPQKNCISLYSFFPFLMPSNYFKDEIVGDTATAQAISDLSALTKDEIREKIIFELKNNKSIYFRNYNLVINAIQSVVFYSSNGDPKTEYFLLESDISGFVGMPDTPLGYIEPLYSNSKGKWSYAFVVKGNLFNLRESTIPIIVNSSTQSQIVGNKNTVYFDEGAVRDFDIDLIVDQIKAGFIPRFEMDALGKINLEFDQIFTDEDGTVSTNGFYVQYETMLCSYLGDYGAGRVLNTFSLLPNEKTSITVRTYKDSTITKDTSSNFIDSSSSSSIRNLENSLQKQVGSQTDQSVGVGFSNTSTSEASSGLLSSIFANGSSTSTSSDSFNFAKHSNDITSVVNNAVDASVNESNYHREVQVNTTTSTAERSGEETTIIRELENVNQSRTLNFVFRELLQEYLCILWLKNIKFCFYNMKSKQETKVNSHNLRSLLTQIIKEEYIEDAFSRLLDPCRKVLNYNEDLIDFFEPRSFSTASYTDTCSGTVMPGYNDCMWLRVKNLSDTFGTITVPGVILSVQSQTLKTSSVLADSFLGQGEALDCYNKDLQNQSIIAQQLRNQQVEQAIGIIDAITDPTDKAANYKKVFGTDCCDNGSTT